MDQMIVNLNWFGMPQPWQLTMIRQLKTGINDRHVPVVDFDGRLIGLVKAMQFADLESDLPATFMKWRNQNRAGWLDQRPVTLEGTRQWMYNVLANVLEQVKGRPLFLVAETRNVTTPQRSLAHEPPPCPSIARPAAPVDASNNNCHDCDHVISSVAEFKL